MNRYSVRMAELKTVGPGSVLVTLGLGSCVVVAIHERRLKWGSLAHIMLPQKADGRRRKDEKLFKYADVAIPSAVRALEEQGGSRADMTAKIAGGSCMFDVKLEGFGDIGNRNVAAAREMLAALGIPLMAEDTGGCQGRSVEFRVETGDFLVRTIRGDERIL